MKQLFQFIFILFILGVGACKKKKPVVSNPSSTKDIYAVGFENNGSNNIAVMWKNGIVKKLTDDTSNANATAIAINGNDIYITGYFLKGSIKVAMLWKNGIGTELSDGSKHAEALGICIDGNNIYVAGNEGFYPNIKAKFWRNGIPFDLTNGVQNASSNTIAVAGNEVYVGGFKTIGTYSNSAIWNSGIETILPKNHPYESGIKSLTIVSGDVYATGYEADAIEEFACSWKNGVIKQLSTLRSNANDIKVINGNEYVAGHIYNGTRWIATYWKNGISYLVKNENIASFAGQINVLDNIVYMVGSEVEIVAGITHSKATIWKDGVANTISTSSNDNMANAFIVVSK